VLSAVYRNKLIKLPRPEFIVLCKGPADFEEKSTQKLSDALEAVEGGGEVNLELVVKLFNMNRPAAERRVSCKRYIIYAVRSDRKFIIVRVYYQFFVDVTNSYRRKAAGY
jgi:hypothetical protein